MKEAHVDSRSERIAKTEEGLDEMQDLLDHAKRVVDGADKADQTVREAAGHARSMSKAVLFIAGALIVVALLGVLARRRG